MHQTGPQPPTHIREAGRRRGDKPGNSTADTDVREGEFVTDQEGPQGEMVLQVLDGLCVSINTEFSPLNPGIDLAFFGERAPQLARRKREVPQDRTRELDRGLARHKLRVNLARN